MTVEIRIAQNTDAHEWDAIISQSPHGTIFHLWDWLKIAQIHTGMELYPLIGQKDGVPFGVFPLFFQRNGPVRMVFSPPPQAAMFYLGPVLNAQDSLSQGTREARYTDFVKAVEVFVGNNLHASYVTIALSPALQDPRPFSWSGYTIEPAYDYVTDLQKGAEYLFQSLSKKQRQDINRAMKRGFQVEQGGQKEIGLIMDLMKNRYEEQSKIVTLSPTYLPDIYEKFKDNITVFVTRAEGEIVTGLIVLKYRDTLYSWIGNPKPSRPVTPSPNDLMAWEVIRYGCEQNFKSHITMSAAGNQRLHTYYASKFEPELFIRFTAKKKSITSKIFENGYTSLVKPLRGRVQQFVSGKIPPDSSR